MNPPPNPRAAAAAAEMRAYNAPLLVNPAPAPREVVIAQWHRSDVARTFSEADVEMWWSMAAAISAAAHAALQGE